MLEVPVRDSWLFDGDAGRYQGKDRKSPIALIRRQESVRLIFLEEISQRTSAQHKSVVG